VTETTRVAAVTGASGYLGGLIAHRLEAEGWRVVRLVRRPRLGEESRRYDIAADVAPGVLDGVDLLVHAAYDFTLTRRDDIWRVNVAGTRRLLDAARPSGVTRIVVLSTMSAYPGTTQLYGQAKLDIESATARVGGVAVRPGLVYGDHPGGMAGALRALTRHPVVPLVAGDAHQFPVHERDLVDAVAAICTTEQPPPGPIGVASPEPITFRRLLEAFAAAEGRRPRFVPIPWQLLYWGLRGAEVLRLPVPFRADSLLGLVRPAPAVPGVESLQKLGVHLRPFSV
jgi:nucleoside-diphosphate-sugar epimerase